MIDLFGLEAMKILIEKRATESLFRVVVNRCVNAIYLQVIAPETGVEIRRILGAIFLVMNRRVLSLVNLLAEITFERRLGIFLHGFIRVMIAMIKAVHRNTITGPENSPISPATSVPFIVIYTLSGIPTNHA